MKKVTRIHIQLKTKSPLIGSGKVKRQYIVCSPIKKSKKKKFKDFTIVTDKVRRKPGELNFHNTKVKRIFAHWNTKGYPFQVHKSTHSIIVEIALNRAQRASRKHELQAIINSIDLCHEMFISHWTKFNISFNGIMKLGLGNFFEFDKIMMMKRNRHLKKEGISSWFEECLKGEEYLKKRYSYYLEDDNPSLTKKLTQIWKTYKGKKLRPENINTITVCCNKAVEFARLNKQLGISPPVILNTIDNMINNFKEYKPKYIESFNTDKFWGDRLPNELVRFGTVLQTDENKIKLLDRK